MGERPLHPQDGEGQAEQRAVVSEGVVMEAREFLDAARDAGLVLSLVAYDGTEPVGRGRALVLDRDNRIAIMLENCGEPGDSGVAAGDIVGYFLHPEAEARITGSPARIRA